MLDEGALTLFMRPLLEAASLLKPSLCCSIRFAENFQSPGSVEVLNWRGMQSISVDLSRSQSQGEKTVGRKSDLDRRMLAKCDTLGN